MFYFVYVSPLSLCVSTLSLSCVQVQPTFCEAVPSTGACSVPQRLLQVAAAAGHAGSDTECR